MAAVGVGSGHAEAEVKSGVAEQCVPVSEVMMVEQGEGAGPPRQVLPQAVSEEVIRTITETNPVYYLQPDGSLVPGGPGVSWCPGGAQAAVSTAPEPPSEVKKPPSQQVRTVSQHVALRQGAASPVTRIIDQKDLKSIRIEVPGLQPKKNKIQIVGPLQLLQKSAVHGKMNTGTPNLLGAQVIRIKPQSEQEQEQFFLQTSDVASPIQLVQNSQLISEKSNNGDNTNTALSPGETVSEETFSAALTQTNPVIISASLVNYKSPDKKQKGKKSLKVKTRSGRISRPPKHKAKDYKFIKVGDLAQTHPSDSDDYSELNTEDEQEWTIGGLPLDSQNNPMKHTLFQCATCEKSYMGKGGLSRHYRLHPNHGQLPSLSHKDATTASGTSSGNAKCLSNEQPATTTEAEKRLCEDPQDPTVHNVPTSASIGCENNSNEKTPGLMGRPKPVGRRSVGRYRRPRKILRTNSPEQDALNKLKLKELLQQCENEDLKELLLPYVTNLFTVYEFLLLKVEYDHPKNPHFPSVYKEFEILHSDIKALAEDYFSNMDQSMKKDFDINDPKVAESLGILLEDSTVGSSSQPNNEQESSETKCSDDFEPPAKRQKIDVTEDAYTDLNSTNEAPSVTCDDEQNESLGNHLEEDESFLMTNTSNRIVLITGPVSHSEHQNDDLAKVLFQSNSTSVPYEITTGLTEVSQPQPDTELSSCSSTPHKVLEEPLTVTCQFGNFAVENIKMAEICPEVASGMLIPCQTQTPAFGQANSKPIMSGLSFASAVHSSSLHSGGIPEKGYAPNVPSDHSYMTYTDTVEIPLAQGGTVLLETSTLGGKCVLENSHEATSCDVNNGDQFVIIENAEEIATEEAGTLLVKTNDATGIHLESVEAFFQMEPK
ncbi:zinc finger 839 [Pelobates cultripes]|nr:zinc finger 839 [Pelobates cultripes]